MPLNRLYFRTPCKIEKFMFTDISHDTMQEVLHERSFKVATSQSDNGSNNRCINAVIILDLYQTIGIATIVILGAVTILDLTLALVMSFSSIY